MSDTPEKKDGPEAPPLKDLTKEKLEGQIALAQQNVNKYRQEIIALDNKIQQEVGVANFADFLLKTYKFAEAPKPDDNKKPTPLEVQ